LLNWRRDPGLERKIEESRMREQQLKQLNARGRELLFFAALL
jgi:hypothetical protein